jgi:hypothetical protein
MAKRFIMPSRLQAPAAGEHDPRIAFGLAGGKDRPNRHRTREL